MDLPCSLVYAVSSMCQSCPCRCHTCRWAWIWCGLLGSLGMPGLGQRNGSKLALSGQNKHDCCSVLSALHCTADSSASHPHISSDGTCPLPSFRALKSSSWCKRSSYCARLVDSIPRTLWSTRSRSFSMRKLRSPSQNTQSNRLVTSSGKQPRQTGHNSWQVFWVTFTEQMPHTTWNLPQMLHFSWHLVIIIIGKCQSRFTFQAVRGNNSQFGPGSAHFGFVLAASGTSPLLTAYLSLWSCCRCSVEAAAGLSRSYDSQHTSPWCCHHELEVMRKQNET